MALRAKKKCSPAEHKAATSHRKAEAKWVKKNLQKHREAAKNYYRKNKAKVKAQRKLAKTSKHQAQVKAARRLYGGGKTGRPREC